MSDVAKKCLQCGADVEYGSFGPCKKKPGNHVVEEVEYYHPGARDLQDGSTRRYFSPTVHLVPVYDYMDEKTQKPVKTKGVQVKFNSGRYATSDPEEQFYLDQKTDIGKGADGFRMWQSIYLTPTQQADIAKAELADTQRQIREANDLLAAVKASKGAR